MNNKDWCIENDFAAQKELGAILASNRQYSKPSGSHLESMEFPKLRSGECDGLGCSAKFKHDCWCNEYLECREEFQRQFNKPWDKYTQECKIWEAAWRFSWNRYVKTAETQYQILKRGDYITKDTE